MNTTHEHGLTVGPELSAVVLMLRNPSVDIRQTVRQVAWILPLVKNPANLGLIIAELVANASRALVNVEHTSLLVDAFAAATDRKIHVSSPTIPPEEWCKALLTAAAHESVPALMALAVASGLLRGGTKDKLAGEICLRTVNFIAARSKDASEMSSAASCICRAQFGLNDSQKNHLPATRLLSAVTNLVYSGGMDALDPQRPVLSAEFGSYSKLFLCIISNPSVPVQSIDQFMDIVENFSQHALLLWPVEAAKPLLFGICIQFEGVTSQLLHRPLSYGNRNRLAGRVLTVLQTLGVVIENTGTFESLEYVKNAALDVLLAGGAGASDRAVMEMAKKFDFEMAGAGQNPVVLGQLVFLLESAEQLRSGLSPPARHSIVQIAQRYLAPPQTTDRADIRRAVFEAAHSLVLALLGNEAATASYDYLNTIVGLFPSPLLSYSQFITALDGVTAAVDERPDKIRVLILLYEKAKSLMPGIPLEGSSENDPPTARAAILGGLIHVIPAICTPYNIREWLDRVAAATPEAFSLTAMAERTWLSSQLADLVGNLDLTVADTGISWWFRSPLSHNL